MKTIFVIMPFTATPTRDAADLTEFFETNLKRRIEADRSLTCAYNVRRSGDTFDITERIIRDLYDADLVICDLSGYDANPNVMYELGVRVAVTNKPVILIREQSAENRRIFDIQGFYAFEYTPTRYRQLEEHLLAKIRQLETNTDSYQSPIFKVLRQTPSVLERVRVERVSGILRMAAESLSGVLGTSEYLIDRFLQRNGIPSPPGSITLFILSNMSELETLDWSTLTIRLKLPPPLQTFLAEPLLTGLLDPQLEREIADLVAAHYNRYFVVDVLWDEPSLDQLMSFLIDTIKIAAVLKALVAYLRPERDEQKGDALVTLTGALRATMRDLAGIIWSEVSS